MRKSTLSAVVLASSSLVAANAAEARAVTFTTNGLLMTTTGSIAVNTPFTLEATVIESPESNDPVPTLTFGFGNFSFSAPIVRTNTVAGPVILEASTILGAFGDIAATFAVFNNSSSPINGVRLAELLGGMNRPGFAGG